MTRREGEAVAVLFSFIFGVKGYDFSKLPGECALLARTGKVPGWTPSRLKRLTAR